MNKITDPIFDHMQFEARERGAVARHSEQLVNAGLVRISEAAIVCAGSQAGALDAVRSATRGASRQARLRQRVMYLAHVGLGVSLTATGHGLGRDRTTVRHGCLMVEDARMEPDVDQALTALEWGVRAQAVMLGASAVQPNEDDHD